MKTITKFT